MSGLPAFVLSLVIGASCVACAGPATNAGSGGPSTPASRSAPAAQATSTSSSTPDTQSGASRPTTLSLRSPTSGAGPRATGTPAPTLGLSWGPNAAGFGDVAPRRVFLGGDPAGDVTSIRWAGWGGASAQGTGASTYVAQDQAVSQGRVEPVTITASQPGTCGGHPAYRAVRWTYPRHGHWRRAD